MKKFIATTTIYEPSVALKKYAAMEGWTLVIAGDKKTPHEKYLEMPGVIYMTPEKQANLYPVLSDLIGWNCMQRRNIAILHAYKLGADVIAIIDDDNIPLENWGKNLLVGQTFECDTYTPVHHGVFDPLSVTEYKHLWHRGYPLIHLVGKNEHVMSKTTIRPVVQADLWNGDPDIDAVCRMEHAPVCTFQTDVFPFTTTVPSPFNSQNIFILREAVRDYFLCPGIGRMDDIWAAYFLESKGHRVVYNTASVFQDRNVHDLVKDFSDEIIGYQNTHLLLKEPSNIQKYIPERSWQAFLEFQREVDI